MGHLQNPLQSCQLRLPPPLALQSAHQMEATSAQATPHSLTCCPFQLPPTKPTFPHFHWPPLRHGCTAVFNSAKVTIKQQSNAILTGTCCTTTGFWCLELPSAASVPQIAKAPNPEVSHHSANSIIANETISKRLAFYHASMCHASMWLPAISSWCRAIDEGRMATWPELTSNQVRKHVPTSAHMIQGHLDQQQANLQSTQPNKQSKPMKLPPSSQANPPATSALLKWIHRL